MKKALKDRWVAALRSGEYAQGSSYLKDETDGGETFHCCLGVLCEISPAVAKRRLGSWGMFSLLSREQLDYAVLDDNTQNTLAYKNDHGTSFKRIATWIERNL